MIRVIHCPNWVRVYLPSFTFTSVIIFNTKLVITLYFTCCCSPVPHFPPLAPFPVNTTKTLSCYFHFLCIFISTELLLLFTLHSCLPSLLTSFYSCPLLVLLPSFIITFRFNHWTHGYTVNSRPVFSLFLSSFLPRPFLPNIESVSCYVHLPLISTTFKAIVC